MEKDREIPVTRIISIGKIVGSMSVFKPSRKAKSSYFRSWVTVSGWMYWWTCLQAVVPSYRRKIRGQSQILSWKISFLVYSLNQSLNHRNLKNGTYDAADGSSDHGTHFATHWTSLIRCNMHRWYSWWDFHVELRSVCCLHIFGRNFGFRCRRQRERLCDCFKSLYFKFQYFGFYL